MTQANKQWLLAERPVGEISESTFRYNEATLPDINDGDILVKILYLSFDPAMRGWMDDVPSYLPPVALGEPMRAAAVGQIEASANPDYPAGRLVMGMLGWQQYAQFDRNSAAELQLLPEGTPPTMALSAFGGTSMTAYFGLLDIGQPKAGETVVVSGAAGATGSAVCQIAKLKGCRVIGIAGGAEKCQWLKDSCGVDAVIDYKHEDVGARLAQLCPMSINVFFDNVGGDILEAGIAQMADFGRIVLCGAIASYNDSEPRPGPRNLMVLIARRVRMQGFIMLDYLERMEEFMTEFGGWVLEGKISYREDIQQGFDNIPATLKRLFAGENQGKQLLKLADPIEPGVPS